MSTHPKITLEQWAAFKTVVDEGSFAAAAEHLNKSQSSISYLISRLNAQLPTPALVIEGRKAVQTEVGKTLYRHASTLLEQAYACEQTAHYLATGWESELRLTVDALTPMQAVMCALQAFSEEAPLTRIKIFETSLSGTDEAILSRSCDLAIAARTPPGFLGVPLGAVEMLAVAHKNHPLNNQGPITETELKTHRQIVLRDTGVKREQNAGWLGAEQRWTVSHFATSVEMVLAGLGFAFLPKHRVQQHLQTGELLPLPIQLGGQRMLELNILQTQKNNSGPAETLLLKKLIAAFKADKTCTDARPDL